MTNLRNRIDEFLLAAQILIENSISDPGISSSLEGYGYPVRRIGDGKKLYDDAVALQNAQKKEYGEQVAATAELNDIWDQADKKYMKTLKVARVAFKDIVKADKATMLFGARKVSLSGWLEQAKAFYANILSDPQLVTIMTGYGYTTEKLQSEAALVDQVAAKNLQQKKEIGEAQAATEARDKKIDELAAFVSDLRAIAKVALDDNPQQLEKLGIVVRSSGATARKQQAPNVGETA